MFKKVLIATDLSPASDALIEQLEGLRAYGATECLLVQFLNMQTSVSMALTYSSDVMENSLQSQEEVLRNQGFTVESKTVAGLPKKEICRLASEEGCSVIVVGARKESLVREQFFGGLAHDLIHHCRTPILLIRLEEQTRDGEVCVEPLACNVSNHIVFPTDFSENAEHAFAVLKNMVADGARQLTLAHVVDKHTIRPEVEDRVDEYKQRAVERLEQMKAELASHDHVAVEIQVSVGVPSAEILRLVRELPAQLVVMGRQGRSFVQELFLGSVSHNVARHAESSVLLIPMDK